jgi:hypothetical protein
MNYRRRGLSWGQFHLVYSVTAFCVWLAGTAGLNAQSLFRPFSADEIGTADKTSAPGKVYANEKASRTEMETDGQKVISIVRFDNKVIWVLMPAQKTYMEMAFSGGPSLAEYAEYLEGAKTKRDSLGSEQVGPYHCDKFRVRVTYAGQDYMSTQWAAKELNGFVVKRQPENGEWTSEFRNVKFGPQDPSLFEVPAGYQKTKMGQ